MDGRCPDPYYERMFDARLFILVLFVQHAIIETCVHKVLFLFRDFPMLFVILDPKHVENIKHWPSNILSKKDAEKHLGPWAQRAP